tara:strand:- start:794 stop:1567 length:774 start_codon:yes stop_codon:yes gene_type:complete
MYINIKDISHKYSNEDEDLLVLKDLSFSVEKDKFVSIVGPSGCGKSTLTKLIAGLSIPYKGKILISGTPVNSPRKSIGMAFQNPVLLEWRTAVDNICLPLEIVSPQMTRKQKIERATELLEMVGLKDFSQSRPSQLSGGMKQRVSLCRSLVHRPEILILDEPFGALDAFTREGLWRTLKDLKTSENFTCILITHDLREAIYLSDEVVILTDRPGTVKESVKTNFQINSNSVDELYSKEATKMLAFLRKQIELSHTKL